MLMLGWDADLGLCDDVRGSSECDASLLLVCLVTEQKRRPTLPKLVAEQRRSSSRLRKPDRCLCLVSEASRV